MKHLLIFIIKSVPIIFSLYLYQQVVAIETIIEETTYDRAGVTSTRRNQHTT
jgi:hypothetical protein